MSDPSAWIRTVLLAGLPLFGCTARQAAGAPQPTDATATVPNAPMPPTDPTTAPLPLPPIDRDAPATFRTATFALG